MNTLTQLKRGGWRRRGRLSVALIIALIMAFTATHVSWAWAQPQPSPAPDMSTQPSLPPPQYSMEVWLGLIAEVALGDSRLWVASVNTAVTIESPGLWVEASTNALWMMLDALSLIAEVIEDDNSPEFYFTKSLNGRDAPVELFGNVFVTVRGGVWERGSHVVDVGGMVAAEVIVARAGGLPTELDIANGVFVGPASGYRYLGDIVRCGVVGFVGPRFSDTFYGFALGVEAQLRVAAPGEGFGLFAKARMQALFNTRDDAAAAAVAVPMLTSELGLLYRW